MRKPFTSKEIRKSISSLKNNKSPGIDNLKAEQLKRSPVLISEEIENNLNKSAKTGEKPSELIQGRSMFKSPANNLTISTFAKFSPFVYYSKLDWQKDHEIYSLITSSIPTR